MSETTGDGFQKPDPDKDESQDQTSGSSFSDPTAPVWADPTAPNPTSPAPKAPYAPVQDTAPAPPTPPVAPPMSNPYAQQPAAQQYGQPADQYGQPQPGRPQYGQPQPGQQYPAYGQQPYATGAAAPSNTSALVLTILSGVSILLGNFLAVASLVFGIMGLTSNSTDPVGSRKKAKTGWIVFAVIWAVAIVVIVGSVIALFVFASNNGGSSTFNSGY